MSRPVIGFAGLGLMGSAIVERLQSLEYDMYVVANKARANVDQAVARGAIEVSKASDLGKNCDIVMMCVDTSVSVETLIYGPEGIFEGVRSGSHVIDFGTSIPDSTKKIARDLKTKNVGYLDAPLGRTPLFAREGKLNIMGAGNREDFDILKPVLDDLGENVFYVGPSASGHSLKLINNFMAMTTAAAMSEAFALGDLANIPRETLYSIMSAGPLHSGMMDFIKEQAIAGEIKLEFSVKNGLKDVGYYVDMAEKLGYNSPLSLGTQKTLTIAANDGWGDKMVPELVDYFSKSSSK
jgi:3-hydroxyisobutyrate dehydrogenase-like beta-hydroxyacid dehydrogenase